MGVGEDDGAHHAVPPDTGDTDGGEGGERRAVRDAAVRYANAANPAAPATTRNPTRAGMGTITGRNPPITHSNWNLVSKPANERPKLASGASRCTIASNARRPAPAAMPTAIAH